MGQHFGLSYFRLEISGGFLSKPGLLLALVFDDATWARRAPGRGLLVGFVLVAVVLWTVSDSSVIDVVMILLGGDYRSQDMDHSDLSEKQANSLATATVEVQPSSNLLGEGHPSILNSQMPPPTLSEDDIPLVIRALEHYNAYLVATERHDARYTELAERLKRKGPDRAETTVIKSAQKTTHRKRG
jgi:hypothetical protein